MMYFGIEQEIPLLRDDGSAFVDSANTTHEELQGIVDELPLYPDDYPRLRVGDLRIKHKRWYVEGYERFGEKGQFLKSLPKCLEIRTVPRETPDAALEELAESYRTLAPHLAARGFRTTWISFHPMKTCFVPDPPLNCFERRMREDSPEAQTAVIAELTRGPDLSFSFPEFDDAALIDAAMKLTYYSPCILPFSFSSPFFDGALWKGLSIRTFKRTGPRPVVMVFLHDNANQIAVSPSLTQPARVPFEAGRIEFKAFDTCRDIALYRSLFALLQGIVLDKTLPGRALTPDAREHQRSAQFGFEDEKIRGGSLEVLAAARGGLGNAPEAGHLDRLDEMLHCNAVPAHDLIKTFQETNSILQTLMAYENLDV
jgi:hypothetical protein